MLVTLLKMAWRNLFRRRLRTVLTLAGVSVAVAALCSLLSFQQGYQNGMKGELERLGAHVLVVPKGCPYDAASIALHGASWPCYLKEAYLTQVKRTEGVQTAAPVLMNANYTESGEAIVTLGVTPEILAVKKNWLIAGAFPTSNGEVLVGSAFAKKHNLVIGQTFDLPGSAGISLKVCGTLAPTQGADDTYLHLTLADAQRLMKRPGELTHILVRLSDPNEMEGVVGALRACEAGMEMNIVPLSHLFNTIQELVNSMRLLLGSVALIALFVAGAAVSNTVMMAVSERVREIGVLRAVGASKGDVFALILLETLMLCLIAGVIGCLASAVFAPFIEFWLRNRLPFSPTDTLVKPSLTLSLFCLLLTGIFGAFAGMFPSWHAAKLAPALSMK